MANVLEYAQLFQTVLDEQMVAGSRTSFMEGNSSLVQYNGGNTVKIPKFVMDGMGDYDRATGYAAGSSTLTYETMTMTQDRGRKFLLDAMDVNETNFVANASTLMGEFQRTQVIPEVDAFRVSKIASLALTASKAVGGYTPVVADILTKLRADIAGIQDVIGADVPLVILMSTAILNILEGSSELTRQLNVGTLQANVDLTYSVKTVDECPIVELPSARMKTAYTFYDGITAGVNLAGGFVPAVGAKSINWLIMAQTAPIAVCKQDAIRIFTPEQNQDADAFKINYRKYHDLWVPENKMDSVFCNIKESLV